MNIVVIKRIDGALGKHVIFHPAVSSNVSPRK